MDLSVWPLLERPNLGSHYFVASAIVKHLFRQGVPHMFMGSFPSNKDSEGRLPVTFYCPRHSNIQATSPTCRWRNHNLKV